MVTKAITTRATTAGSNVHCVELAPLVVAARDTTCQGRDVFIVNSGNSTKSDDPIRTYDSTYLGLLCLLLTLLKLG